MKNSAMMVFVAAVSLTALAYAGANGISPTNGTYTFHRTDPSPAQDVGSGQFTSTPTSNDMEMNPGSGSMYHKYPDGKYKKSSGAPASFCFHATQSGTPPYTYEQKYNGDVIASGELQP